MVTCIAALLLVQQSAAPDIVRLDGTVISAAAATEMAKSTLTKHHVTGAQIVIINNDKPVWTFSSGLRTKTPDLPMESDTMTWAASITKSVFTTYAVSLAERGVIDLDKPFASQLRQPLNQYDAYKEEASLIVNDPNWSTITPRMLMSHTSGLGNFAYMEPDKKMRLRFKPGTGFRYSGQGFNLVQLLIEEKMGRPITDLMEEALFQPFGMLRTSMSHKEKFLGNIADRFDANEKFIAQTRRNARAAGSMTSTATDLATFVIAFANGRVVPPKVVDSMLKPVIKITSLHQFPGSPDDPQGEESVKVGLAYGTGWGLLERTQFGPAFFKEGHGDGAQTYLIYFRKSRSGMVILTNSDNGELSFRELLEGILGNTVTPWEWEGYTRKSS